MTLGHDDSTINIVMAIIIIIIRVYVGPSDRLPVCLSRRSTAAAACGWFAAERPAAPRTSY